MAQISPIDIEPNDQPDDTEAAQPDHPDAETEEQGACIDDSTSLVPITKHHYQDNNPTEELAAPTEELAAPEIISAAASQVEDALAPYKEMRILLVGKSGVGKSSFVNSLLQVHRATVGRLKPETNTVTEYPLILNPDAGDPVTIRVFDTPGFGSSKKENKKYIAEIREKCEIVDVIFLCIRVDDQFREEDRKTVALLAKEFNDKFWKKSVIVFTRANMVRPVGEHKRAESRKEYLRGYRDDLKDEVQKVFKKANITIPPFVLAGAPESTPEERMIPSIDDPSQEEVDWLPVVVAELFKSGCSDNAKAVLLKSGWKKWAKVSAGMGAGTALGVAVGGGVMAAGVATLLLPPIGEIALVAGGAIVIASLAAGGASSVGSGATAAISEVKRKKKVEKIKQQVNK